MCAPRLVACSLSLVFAYGVALAQSDAQSESNAPPPTTGVGSKAFGPQSPEEIRASGEQWFTQCMQDWDAATHMTKNEWEHSCRRVAQDRVKFLLDEAKAK